MTSLLLKVALAAGLTIASVVGLIAISGSIIFADLKTDPASIVQDSASGPAQPPIFSGPSR
jgi:hypothetical protein